MKSIVTPETDVHFIRQEDRPVWGNIPELAREFGVSRYYLRQLVKLEKVHPLVIGGPGRYLFKLDREEVRRVLHEHATQEASRGPVQR